MSSQSPTARKGEDIAIFFAVSEYDEGTGWNKLSHTIKEAERIANLLQSAYGFQTEIIKNPDKTQIIRKLKELQQKEFNANSQLLLFFTGHGFLSGKEGFFISKEIKNTEADINALEYTRLKNLVNNMSCDNTLLMIDACHSGALFLNEKGGPKWGSEIIPEVELAEKTLVQNSFRMGITSGAANKQTPAISEFSKGFYEALLEASNQGLPTISIGRIWEKKLKGISPAPQIGKISPLHNTGGNFYFFLSKEKEVIHPVKKLQGKVRLINHWEGSDLYVNGQLKGALEQGEYNFDLNVGYYQFQLKKENSTKWQSEEFYLKQTGKRLETSIPPPPKAVKVAETEGGGERVKKEEETKSIDLPSRFPSMVKITGGTFTMGCAYEVGSQCASNASPKHEVTVSSYYIGKYEVTNEQFCTFLNEKGNQEEGGGKWLKFGAHYSQIVLKNGVYAPKSDKLTHPVAGVTWYGAKAYCDWLAEKTGESYRLPTEAEWEFAARGGNQSEGHRYAGTTTQLSSYVWHASNAGNKTQPVGQKGANELGLYDMSGNMKEWCSDIFEAYTADSQDNPTGAKNGKHRVLRGGSAFTAARHTRVSSRLGDLPIPRFFVIGFRVAKTL